MNIQKFSCNIFSNKSSRKLPINETHLSKRYIPRYLYHFTSGDCYQKIKNEGVIVSQKEGLMDESIFLFDLENMLKFWNFYTQKYKMPLKEGLLNRFFKRDKSIVLLRIDTQNLSKNSLKIRSQDYLFKPENLNYLKDKVKKYGSVEKFPKSIKNKLAHYINGDDARKAKIYKQRKNSIEYVYPFDILKSDFTKIGQYTLEEGADLSQRKDFFTIMADILKNTPEFNAVKRFLPHSNF
ncbi:hypothetical protein J6E39_08720 [bacterium]|nr:hypothetical protein [bacterium]